MLKNIGLYDLKETESMEFNDDKTTPTKISNLRDIRAQKKAQKLENNIPSDDRIDNGFIVNFQRSSTTSPNRSTNSSYLKSRKEKNPEQERISTLRNNFQQQLTKLYSSETKDLAMKELKKIISCNVMPEALRIFLSSLCEYKKIATPIIQECELTLIGQIVICFKEKLLDPLDKPPNLAKTVLRVIDTVQAYFKVPNAQVQKICSLVYSAVYTNCLTNQNLETKMLLSYEPLSTIIFGGTDRISQTTASICLAELLTSIVEQNDIMLLEEIRKKYINAFLKLTYENQYMIISLGIILANTDMRLSATKINNIMEKLIIFLNTTSPNYMIKIEACQTLKVIATKLQKIAESFIGNLHEEVIANLRNLSKDRITKVQTAANDSLKQWLELQNLIQNVDEKKKNQEISGTDLDPDSIIKLRTGLPVDFSNDQQQNFALQENSNLFDAQKIKGLQDSDRIENFPNGRERSPLREEFGKKSNLLRKKSGTGGGYVAMETKDRSSETHIRKHQSIKEKILGNKDLINPKTSQHDFVAREPGKNEKVREKGQKLLTQQDSPYFRDFKPEQELRYQTFSNVAAPDNPKDLIEEEISDDFSLEGGGGDMRINPNAQLIENKFTKGKIRPPKNFLIRQLPGPNQRKADDKQIRYNQENIMQEDLGLASTVMMDTYLEDTMAYDDKEVMNSIEEISKDIQTKNYIRPPQNGFVEIMKQNDANITETWEQVLQKFYENDIEKAFEISLDSGDDLYLLRLMAKAGPCINKLTKKTAMRLISKITKVLSSKFLEKLALEFFQECFDLNVVDNLNIDDQNNLSKTLYELSGNENGIGEQAADLYSILMTLMNNQL